MHEKIKQKTLAEMFSLSGIGLHSGKAVMLTAKPAPANTGIVFKRVDIADAPNIPADAYLITDTVMSSNLQIDDVKVGTVEHLLAAFAGLAIDNAIVEVTAPEIPIMDGSARIYTQAILQAGIKQQASDKKFLKICKPVQVTCEDKWAQLTELDGCQMDFKIEFNHPAITQETQTFGFEFTSQNFITQIADARTFGFIKDIEILKANGLALGGSLDNAIVLDDEGILNDGALRFKEEFVRHKILDAIGDLSLIGYSILGRFEAYKSGHALNNKLVKAVLADKTNYEIVTKYDIN